MKDKKEKGTFDNVLPMTIEVNVYYIEDDEEYIVEIDKESMREEFEEKLKELEKLRS